MRQLTRRMLNITRLGRMAWRICPSLPKYPVTYPFRIFIEVKVFATFSWQHPYYLVAFIAVGDTHLVEAVRGLHPNKEQHAAYLDIEPQTGLLAGITLY